jgi:putative endonuclease
MNARSPGPRARPSRKAAGHAAEAAASDYLQSLGYRTLERNWRCRRGEIDLIMRDQDTIVFVEVRSRLSSGRFGTAIESITPQKCRRVRELAAIYLHVTGKREHPIRFDAVAVTVGQDGAVSDIRHVSNAF